MPVLLRSEVEPLSFLLNTLENTAGELLILADHGESELSILLVDDEKIKQLNSTYRDKDKTTNVLSFPMLDDDDTFTLQMLGDIVISVDTAAREAETQGKTLIDHLTVLLIHGFVHLLGFDHEQGEDEALEMIEKENELLQKISAKINSCALSR